MEVIGQLHAPAALALSRRSTLLEEKARCTPELVWTFRTTEKNAFSCRDSIVETSILYLVKIPITLTLLSGCDPLMYTAFMSTTESTDG